MQEPSKVFATQKAIGNIAKRFIIGEFLAGECLRLGTGFPHKA